MEILKKIPETYSPIIHRVREEAEEWMIERLGEKLLTATNAQLIQEYVFQYAAYKGQQYHMLCEELRRRGLKPIAEQALVYATQRVDSYIHSNESKK